MSVDHQQGFIVAIKRCDVLMRYTTAVVGREMGPAKLWTSPLKIMGGF